MPTTISAALIVLIAVVPGMLGNAVYTTLLGTDWREKEWATVARVLSFSAFGLALYAWFASKSGAPAPMHVLPSTYTNNTLGSHIVGSLSPGYVGHVVGGGLTGGLAALGTRVLARISGRSAHPAAWDEFVAVCARERWVVVALTTGEAFCGIIETADASVDTSQRDLLLSEPARYDADQSDYIATDYRHLFLRAAQIDSIATVRDSKLDKSLRTTRGDALFTGERNEGK